VCHLAALHTQPLCPSTTAKIPRRETASPCSRPSPPHSVPCRPRLQSMMESLSDAEVQSASRKAFTAMPDLADALKEMTVLKGVGPATASALLAAHSPAVAPFMSDEVLLSALSLQRRPKHKALQTGPACIGPGVPMGQLRIMARSESRAAQNHRQLRRMASSVTGSSG